MASTPQRLQRYRQYIDSHFLSGIRTNHEYSLDALKEPLKARILAGQFRRIVFTGMGCSAVVSDLIKGFFAFSKVPLDIYVVNDYDLTYLISAELLSDQSTLVIVSSYSGYSQEPINAYQSIQNLTENIILLTSGGRLGQIGKEKGTSIIYWQLDEPDREYPLFHVPQYFGSLLDIFFRLGILDSNYSVELAETARFLEEEYLPQKAAEAIDVARRLRDREITLLASAKWHDTLLKIVRMHLNEIAMVPAHCNLFHEFCHSEVAVFTNPQSKLAILLFRDAEEDAYTASKMTNLIDLLSSDVPHNTNITVVPVEMSQISFFGRLFSALLFVHLITYELGCYMATESRDLISTAAGNPWYNSKTIQQELGSLAHEYID